MKREGCFCHFRLVSDEEGHFFQFPCLDVESLK